MRHWTVFAIGATAIAALSLPVLASLNAPILSSAKIEHQGTTLELHFKFQGATPPLRLSAHGSELWIDLGRTQIEIPPRPLFGYEAPPVVSVRVIDAGGGSSRIIVAVEGKADYAIAALKHEIVLRVAPAGSNPNIAAPILVHEDAPRPAAISRAAMNVTRASKRIASASPITPELRYNGPEIVRPRPPDPVLAALQTPSESDSQASTVIEQPLVIIDPGHGGFDPGTQSAAGVVEKDLALQISRALKTALEARGIRAELTRSTDVFISLPERTRIANNANADLFVSIHLNSSPNIETTGIEVYYLNNTTDHATIRLARIENGGARGYGAPDGANLNYILTDLRQNYKASETAAVARMIDAQTVADLDAGLGINVNALGAKMGPFYVLVGAHMPSVLVECGFLSNSGEATRLASAQYEEILAGGIAAAIVHYFKADIALGNL